MSMATWIAIALVLIIVVGSVRILRVAAGAARPPLTRRIELLGLQALASLLLYFTLVPPQRNVDAGQLIVLTGNAALAGTVPAGATVIALPEAPANADAVRAPDLATALRQHPGGSSLLLVGDGLSARDRDVALPPQVTLQSPSAPRGWLELS
ncbi:MAG: hypothetical protein ACREOX_08985, partial [Stenotrophomonas sp.]